MSQNCQYPTIYPSLSHVYVTYACYFLAFVSEVGDHLLFPPHFHPERAYLILRNARVVAGLLELHGVRLDISQCIWGKFTKITLNYDVYKEIQYIPRSPFSRFSQ